MSILSKLGDRTERELRHRIYGVVVGIVTNNKDDSGGYRVKVRFPWLPNGDESGQTSQESDWCRVATIMAGNQRGWNCLPEKDDEVLVAFEHGDIMRPYVIGCLWNKNDAPILDNKQGKNNLRQFKSRSGHILEFCDDKDNGEKIRIVSNGAAKIVIDDKDKKIEIYGHGGKNYCLIDDQNNTIHIESNDKVELKSKGDFSIECDNLNVHAKSNITIKADSNLDMKASSNFTLKAGSQGTVQSGSTLTVKGSQVNIN